MITATIIGVPATATAHQKGVFVVAGKPRFFTKKRVRDAQNHIVAALRPHAPAEPIDGPAELTVQFVFPYTQRHRANILSRIGVGLGLVAHDRRPDLDHLPKGLLDALQPAGWITDDARIHLIEASKYYGEEPQTHIILQPTHNED